MDIKSCISILAIIVISFSLSSCNSEDKNNANEVKVKTIGTDEIKLAENSLFEFYSYLDDENYETCLTYFTSELRETPGDIVLVQAMQERTQKMGVSENHEILYSFTETSEKNGDVYGFHTKCLSKLRTYHFEKVSLINVDGKFQISNYEYGNLPYVSVEKANDKNSSLNVFLTEMYKAINTDDFEEVHILIDSEVLLRLGKENLKQGYEREIAKKFEITSFTVEQIETRFEEGIPVVEMLITETASEEIYKSSVMLTNREEGYRVAIVKDVPIVDVNVKGDLSEDESNLVMVYVNGFYDAYKNKDIDKIIEYIDDDVYLNNTHEGVRQSFVNRLEYFGLPTKFEVSKFEREQIGDRSAYKIDILVTSESSKKSQESLVLIHKQDNEYRIYAYEYVELID